MGSSSKEQIIICDYTVIDKQTKAMPQQFYDRFDT